MERCGFALELSGSLLSAVPCGLSVGILPEDLASTIPPQIESFGRLPARPPAMPKHGYRHHFHEWLAIARGQTLVLGVSQKAPEAGDGSPFGRFAFRTLHQSCLMSMTCALRFTNSRRLSFLMRAPSGRGRPQWLDVFTDSASLTQPVVPLPRLLFFGRRAAARSRARCGRGGRRCARLHGTRP